jgi:hypothetical protein
MYIPAQFKSDDVAAAIELMRKHSFATLICNDDDGRPFVTYLPLHVDVGDATASLGPPCSGTWREPIPTGSISATGERLS